MNREFIKTKTPEYDKQGVLAAVKLPLESDLAVSYRVNTLTYHATNSLLGVYPS